jgi:hypothetical protein
VRRSSTSLEPHQASYLKLSLALLLPLECRPGAFDELTGPERPISEDAGHDAGSSDAGTIEDGGPGRTPDSDCGDTRIDLHNCGECGRQCVASRFAVARCDEASCVQQLVKLEDVRGGPLHGAQLEGQPFPSCPLPGCQLCEADEVLVGISGLGSSVALALRVHCARVGLLRTSSDPAVELVPTRMAMLVGGAVTPPPPAYELLCPAGELVTAIGGATWMWNDSPSIRQLSLTCSRVEVGAAGALSLEPSTTLTIGDTNDATAVGFLDPCGIGSAVVGFTGRSGAYLDAISTQCATLVLKEEPASSAAPGSPGGFHF